MAGYKWLQHPAMGLTATNTNHENLTDVSSANVCMNAMHSAQVRGMNPARDASP